MSKTDISIIVPIYNTEKYLNKCLDSLINQSKKELEFILINDGSKDNSEEKIKEYKDERIKYYKNKNQGIGKTRNFGIEKATGKYLMFLDSDDYLEKDACELLYKKAEKEKLDLVVCDYYKVYSNGTKEEFLIDDFVNSSLESNNKLLNIINLGPCNKIYLKELITKNNIKYLEDLKYEDTTFVGEAMLKAKKIGKLNKPLHNYVIRENSETTIRDEKCFDIIKVVDLLRNYYKENNFPKEELDKLTVRILTNYTIQQRMQSDKTLAMKFIDEAFSYLEKEVKDYKNNKYYENRSILKRVIEKNKCLTKLYCKLYK